MLELAENSLDLASVLERLGGDRELLGEIAGIFLDVTPQLLTRLATADAADNCTGVVKLAHELKGMSANLGACEMLRQCKLLEMSARQGLSAQMHEHSELLQREFDRVRDLLITYRQETSCGGVS